MRPKLLARGAVLPTVLAVCLFLAPAALGAVKCKVLHSFGTAGDGTVPAGAPVLDGEGNLYGVTGGGGTGQCSDYGCGTVYELMPGNNGKWKEVILHSFTAGSDGAGPWGAPVFDVSGDLYGAMVGDSSYAVGGVFELIPKPGGWSNDVIYASGAGPGLVMDGSGNLYGGIGDGRYKYYGAIAELSPGSGGWNYADLYDFCSQYGCPDGWGLYYPLIWDGPDKLYGTTYYGGMGLQQCLYGCGVIFRMIRESDGMWSYHVLHRFDPSTKDGLSPAAGLVMDAAGNFYGNTVGGGPNKTGTVFKLAYSGGRWKETQLYAFPNCADGCLPSGTMVFDKAGNLYGTASGGIVACGGETCGTVFKLTPQKNGKWKYSVVYKFHGPDGFGPVAVITDDKGHLFGTTGSGGKYNWGVAFEITP